MILTLEYSWQNFEIKLFTSRNMFHTVFLNFISYLFLHVITYSCIDFKYHSALFWLYPFYCTHPYHKINFLKRSTNFLYDAKFSTSITALTHTKLIYDIWKAVQLVFLVVRMDGWLLLNCSVLFWIKEEFNLWKVVYPTLPTEIKGLVLSANTFVRR